MIPYVRFVLRGVLLGSPMSCDGKVAVYSGERQPATDDYIANIRPGGATEKTSRPISGLQWLEAGNRRHQAGDMPRRQAQETGPGDRPRRQAKLRMRYQSEATGVGDIRLGHRRRRHQVGETGAGDRGGRRQTGLETDATEDRLDKTD